MRIAFIGQKGIPALSGGVEKYVEQVAKRMAAHGHQVTVYVRSNYTPVDRTEWEGVHLVHTPGIHTKHLDAITCTFTAVVHALFQPYDIVHFQSIGPSTLAWILKVLKRDTIVLATFHSIDYLHQKWGWFARTFLRLGGSGLGLHLSHCICQHSGENIVFHTGDFFNRNWLAVSNGNLRADFE